MDAWLQLLGEAGHVSARVKAKAPHPNIKLSAPSLKPAKLTKQRKTIWVQYAKSSDEETPDRPHHKVCARQPRY